MLNKEIRDLENKDMNRRQIKSDKSEDKMFDFLKIKAIKKEKKIEYNRKQLLQDTSSSQPSNDA